ncbi:MAG TPA: hypothetical protein VGO65_08100, partial [Pseudolysinimonas sp.]|nr:hypothetical protein [Pseudolysinimonas sp.]
MRSAAAATALGITLILAGLSSCAGPQDPVQPPEPDPSSSPVFASDEEALAAAEELYGRYLDISNAIGADGWSDTSELALVLKGAALEDDLDSVEKLAAHGWKQVGKSRYDSLTLQQFSDHGPGSVAMTVYLCLD